MQSKEMRAISALGKLAIISLLVILLISLGANGFLLYSKQKSIPPTTSTITETTQLTQVQVINSIVRDTTTLTSTTYEQSANNSLSAITMANITTNYYPQSIGVNPNTNTIYVLMTDANGSALLGVINGVTNSMTNVITGVEIGVPLVNPQTNMIYLSHDIINGSTDKIVESINSTFVAVDTLTNTIYASSTLLPRNGATTTLYEYNGTNDQVIRSQSYSNGFFGPFALDENAHTLYTPVCSDSFVCSPSYVLAINDTTLALEGNMSLNTFGFFSIAANEQSNMIYVTTLQNQLVVINGTSNQIIERIPITAFANEIWSATIDPATNELFLLGAPNCNDLTGCQITTLYVLSSINYGLFTTFVTNANGGGGLVSMQFDPANNDTYMAFQNSILVVKVPAYHITYLLP